MPITALRALLAVLIAGVFFFYILGFLDVVAAFGHAIPQPDMVTDYIIGVIWAMFIGLSIFLWPVSMTDRRRLVVAWFFRCLVTLGFMLVYENHYGLDAYGYFEGVYLSGGKTVSFVFGDGTKNMSNLAYLHNVIFPDSYHMMKVSFSLIGFAGIFLIYRAAVRFLGKDSPKTFYILALFPSIIFWSSILGKDPVVLFGIAVYIYGVVFYVKTGRLRHLFLIGFGVLIASFIRIWLSPILIAPLAVFVLFRLKGLFTKLILIAFVGITFASSVQFFASRFSIETKADLVSEAHGVSRQWAVGGSGQKIGTDFTSLGKIAVFLPLGIFTALFRPLPGEVAGFFPALAGIENLLLLFLLLRGLLRLRLVDLSDPIVLWAALLILTWGSVYGLVSYQNLGAAVRFRLQIMPVLLGFLFYINRKRDASPAPAR